jgi:pimeloyl-ACP methyl ester carboxylesterase
VVIGAAVAEAQVRTVITLATQAYGTDDVSALAPRPLLLIHGLDDEVLPPGCSRLVHRNAGAPKVLRMVGASHRLDESAGEVHQLVTDWLVRELRPEPRTP